MSDRFKFALPEGISQLTIYAAEELIVRGSERRDLSVACDDEPILETTDAGVVLRLMDDAEVEAPALLDLLIAQVGDELSLRSLQGQVHVEAAPDDVSIKHCGQVTIGRVQGDLSAQEVQRLEVSAVDDDASVRSVQELILGAVGDDLSVSQAGRVTVKSVGGDVALTNIQGNVEIDSITKDFAATNVGGALRVNTVGSDAVIRGRAMPGQQIHVRAWDSVTLVLNGLVTLHRLEGHGAWSALPDWDEIRRQAPNPAQEGGSEVLVAAGDRVTAASYDFNASELTENLNQLGAQLSSLGQTIADQVRSSLAAADFEGIGRQIKDAMADIDWSGLKKNVRAAERAQQQAERVARQAERRHGFRPEVNVTMHPPTPPTPPRPPTPSPVTPAAQADRPSNGNTSQERLLVLQMIQQGKITPEQGEMLLDALPL